MERELAALNLPLYSRCVKGIEGIGSGLEDIIMIPFSIHSLMIITFLFVSLIHLTAFGDRKRW